MSNNLIQFASIFDAAGAKINFDTQSMEAEVIDSPKNHKTLFAEAVSEIDHFLDTKTYNDGIAIFAIADFIDGDPNPIHDAARTSILENVGLMKEGRYVSQQLALLKSNKSWHTSEVPNTCTYFGDLCTSRGIVEIDGKRGRKSTRPPNDYHVKKANGLINREQLVTPALDKVHRLIPADSLISASNKTRTVIRLDRIQDLDPEELQMILEKIRSVEVKNATV